MEEMIRVAFDRVANQIPSDLFKLAPDRLGANLLEAGFLLVPRSLVWPQLAEGLVQVPWHVVADQFPQQALAIPPGEVAGRIANGLIVLPLDEIVRQMPVELFALTSPEVDVRGIESFPPPFQPHVPPPSASQGEPPLETAPLEAEPFAAAPSEPGPVEPGPVETGPVETVPVEMLPLEAPRIETAPSETEWIETVTDVGAVSEEAASEESVPAAPSAWEDPPSTPPRGSEEAVLTVEPAWRAIADEALAPAVETELLADDPEPEEPAPLAPAAAYEAVAPIRLEPEVPRGPVEPRQSAPGDGERVQVRRIAALLGPVMTALETGSVAHGGRTVLTVLPPDMDEAAAVGTGLRVLSFLTDPRLPSPATQATLRTLTGALVLTPLAPGDPDGPVLLTATPAGASLALLERLSLRAARDWQAEHGAVRPARIGQAVASDSGLTAADVPPHVQTMAESLQAFGAVSPAVLRDTVGALHIYLFLPRGVEPMPLGGLARDLTQALERVPLGPVESVVLRAESDGRLVVRALAAAEGSTVLVAGGGPVDRPGLARIELDRAAAGLCAVRA
jgi:hypothetical protein